MSTHKIVCLIAGHRVSYFESDVYDGILCHCTRCGATFDVSRDLLSPTDGLALSETPEVVNAATRAIALYLRTEGPDSQLRKRNEARDMALEALIAADAVRERLIAEAVNA